ncbi:mitochondrial ubiquitin ligase activator of nfkb 1-like [Gigantopelta aegis]|uniref:mitochondrial ubiquitin ligase activator of nfkb 1-like n=1 Tax=Gigantopelta aegis TaxID=1735272 RepID=UPI001B88C97E|nr:mitochondrial ubiquitin ligase activator of nfkb 1-like [Gigantopelta aegis]
MDGELANVAVGLGVSAALYWLSHKLYESNYATAKEIQSTEVFAVGEDLFRRLKEVDGNSIAYATVEGVVYPTYQNQILQSKHSPLDGVIRHWLVVEHKSKKEKEKWHDGQQIVTDTLQSVPFVLANPVNSEQKVHITKALAANFILDTLTITFNQYNPQHPNLILADIARAVGEYTKGFQEREKMLLVGTNLVGIGKVCLENSQVKLVPPSQGRYILSRLNRNGIIAVYESRWFIYEVIAIIFGLISTRLAFCLVCKLVKRFIQRIKGKRKRKKSDEIRATTRATPVSDAAEADPSTCVICVSRPTDVVVLDCGHVCMCSQCARILPEPKLCPMCRALVKRFVPLYRS